MGVHCAHLILNELAWWGSDLERGCFPTQPSSEHWPPRVWLMVAILKMERAGTLHVLLALLTGFLMSGARFNPTDPNDLFE